MENNKNNRCNKSSIMIVTNQATDTKRNFDATSTRNRIMASTMSVDEYFDELISQVHPGLCRLMKSESA
ncbi:MAG: hypothetical protein VZR53_10295 [Prevotella sp.]|nr:hypothetical protein [Prevotella sp.]